MISHMTPFNLHTDSDYGENEGPGILLAEV